jgi:hypothetical protein
VLVTAPSPTEKVSTKLRRRKGKSVEQSANGLPETPRRKKQPSWKKSVDGVEEGVLVTAPSPTEPQHETPPTKGKRFEKFSKVFLDGSKDMK